MSWAVMRTRSPARRTLPSSTVLTPSVAATSGMPTDFPLKMNDEVREATRNCGSLTSRFRISSAMPSLKYSFSLSPLMFMKGSTAMDFRLSAGFTCAAGAGGAGAGDVASPGGAAGASADLGGVRCTPSGPRSNAQASETASRKPSTTSAVTRVTDQSGTFRLGSTVEATSMTIQPPIAYRTTTRMTRRRFSSAKSSPTPDFSAPSLIAHAPSRAAHGASYIVCGQAVTRDRDEPTAARCAMRSEFRAPSLRNRAPGAPRAARRRDRDSSDGYGPARAPGHGGPGPAPGTAGRSSG